MENSQNSLNVVSLYDSILEAQLLMSYAAQNGTVVDQKHIDAVVQAGRLINSSELSFEMESKFWSAFTAISVLVKPVSVSSLKAIREPQKNLLINHIPFFRQRKGSSIANKFARKYRIWGFVFLVLMLLVQVYWVIGNNLVTKIDVITTELDNLQEEMNNANKTRSADMISGDIETKGGLLLANFKLLDKWNSVPKKFISAFDESKGKQEIEDPKGRPSPIAMANIAMIKANFVLYILQSYLLPLLYGLLGAFSYVLRYLAEEIRHLTFTDASIINYRLRLHLGTLAGLAIGWFLQPLSSETTPSIGSLSPLALSFLAGYSVEVLFSTLDKFIKTFQEEKRP